MRLLNKVFPFRQRLASAAMTKMLIDFEWKRDPTRSGYVLLASEPRKGPVPTRNPLGLLLRQAVLKRDQASPERIVFKGESLVKYRPFELSHALLYRAFAEQATSSAGLLSFVSEFGSLTEAGNDENCGDPVLSLLNEARLMRDTMTDVRKVELASRNGPSRVALSGINITLVVDAKGIRLQMRPPSFLAALWLQLGQDLST
jgi:hypothetical protein